MELKFDIIVFYESPSSSNKDDFAVSPDFITSYYNANSRPYTIRIKIGENNHDNFLGEKTKDNPIIKFSGGLTYMYPPIERIKDKIK